MTRRAYDVRIADRLQLQASQVAAAVRLLEDGNTVPFIARYRKEITGSLDELKLRAVDTELGRLRKLDDRRDTILGAIQEQAQLTPELERSIEAAETLTALEDIYQPYKRKRRTRATIAAARGLAPLADMIQAQPTDRTPPEAYAKPFVGGEVGSVEEALAGARDIVAERISDHPGVRGAVRDKALEYGVLVAEKVKKAQDERGTYKNYYEYRNRVSRVRPHQTLAINRGESEKVLRVKLELEERDWLQPITGEFRPDGRSGMRGQLEEAIADSAKRLLLPSIERDVRRVLTETAEDHAIGVFAENLRGLLSQPPLAGRVVIGLDPAYRTGCKVAVVDATGKVVATAAIYPHPPQKRWHEALETLDRLVTRHGVTLIAIGNGTASRETEQLAAELIGNRDDLHYLIVNEAGASVYSASELARDELPGLDVTLRGAVSIARRVQDPLAELVKIDPKSIGVGLYQHDVNQVALGEAAHAVVESVVNRVGVEVNTASAALLAYVAGIGPKVAANIVAHRDEKGPFRSRAALKKVSGLGPKSFEQCAGFLRVRDSKNELDASAIHPESYAAAQQVMSMAGIGRDMPFAGREAAIGGLRGRVAVGELAEAVGVGVPTLQDILEQLVRPGRDPREDLPAPILRRDVMTMDDLLAGMLLSGTVRNVVDFGAFVDIGVKQDGLLHVSEIPRGEGLTVGDVIEVKIKTVDKDRGRIGLAWGM
jgi:protein Tex